jgi:hypothetical protein
MYLYALCESTTPSLGYGRNQGIPSSLEAENNRQLQCCVVSLWSELVALGGTEYIGELLMQCGRRGGMLPEEITSAKLK